MVPPESKMMSSMVNRYLLLMEYGQIKISNDESANSGNNRRQDITAEQCIREQWIQRCEI